MKRFRLSLISLCAALLLIVPTELPVFAASGTRVERIDDPILHMKAFDVQIPEGWKFQGILSQGTPCSTEPFPVFRAYSADGLSEFRRMPRFDWVLPSSNRAVQGVAAKCPPIGKRLTAIEFIHYLSDLMGYKYVADWQLPGERDGFEATIKQANARYAQSGMRGYAMSGDFGAARTEIVNGTFTIEQQLYVVTICNQSPLFDGTIVTGCFAQVRAIRAPKGKLDALVQRIAVPGGGAVENPAWRQMLFQVAAQHSADIMRQREASFRQWSDVMKHQHEQFMTQFNAEGAARTRRFEGQQVIKGQVASDWVDYALNQQTVSGSGGVAKVSSAYGTTWSNGQGQYYQTNDPGANPNGTLSGTWTPQAVVHGNGQP